MNRQERKARLRELQNWVEEQNREFQDEPFPDEIQNAWEANNRELTEHTIILRELEERDERVARASGAFRGGPTNTPEVLRNTDRVYDWCASQGMIRRDDGNLSFGRYLRGIATGNWDGAEAERGLLEGTSTAGGVLVPTPLAANIIDKARNATRVFQAGAVTVPMKAQTLKVPRLTVDNTPAWHSEAGSLSPADLTFDSVTFTAQTLARVIKLSVELFEDADPSAQSVIENSFAKQIALEVDRVALRGSGTSPEPRGVLNQTGVTTTTHGANGSTIGSPVAAGVMNWEFLGQATGIVRGQNFEPNAHIMAPRTLQSLSLVRDTTNQFLRPPPLLDNIERLTTNQIPITLTVGTSTDCSEVYTADWTQLMVGMRTEFNLQFLRERFLADTLEYAFLAYLRADIQLSQPKAFNVDTGVRS